MTDLLQNAITDTYLNSFDSISKIKNKNIVDIGCGHGYAARQFIDKGAHAVTALEIEPRDPSLNKPHYLLDTDATFVTSWNEIINSKFDIVWSHHVIEHVEDYFSFLRDIHSILNDTGELWLACPNMAQHAVYSPGHIHNFQAAQLVEVLKRTGFAIGDISVWTHNGQLRARVPKNGNTNYPTPMQDELNRTGRCPADVLTYWNWK